MHMKAQGDAGLTMLKNWLV